MMVLHSLIIGVLLYLFMIFILGQNKMVAENRSILGCNDIDIYDFIWSRLTNFNK